VVNVSPVVVRGTVVNAASLACNRVAASVASGAFEVVVPLHSAENLIACMATGTDGRLAGDSLSITLDDVAPVVRIDSPAENAVTESELLDVTGIVNDVLSGFVGVSPTVSVNGKTAIVPPAGSTWSHG
jgi:hypothetical protein